MCWFICSIEFDRDDEFFATAGVSRRIKVFDFSTVCHIYHLNSRFSFEIDLMEILLEDL